MEPSPDLFPIKTDFGMIGLTRVEAQALYVQLHQFLGHANPGTITPKMLAAGCEATWMLRSNRWLLSDVQGIVRRAYNAMRGLE